MNGVVQDNQQKQVLLQFIHDLNQPLTVIKAYIGGCELRLKKNELNSEDVASALQKIMEHTEYFAKKIYSMGKMIDQAEDIDIYYLIAEITSLFNFEIDRYDIQFSLDIQEYKFSDSCINKFLFKHIMFIILKQCIDTVEENRIEKAKLVIQTKKHKKNAFDIRIKSNFPIAKYDLEKKITYCRSLLFEDCGIIGTKLFSQGVDILFTIFHKDNRYAS
jgi:hypothetical protein